MSLLVEDLSCARGGRVVFLAAAFDAPSGRALLLKGPNGSGKSTLLRALAGLLPATGQVAWLSDDGVVDLGRDRDGFQECVAYAGHLDGVKPSLTVAENLRFWSALYGGGGPVDAALDRFGLDAIADAPAAYCSAGQKRRLGLARLAVIDRPLWLLDEPTVSLDQASAAAFAGLVSEHCAGGGVAIIATHIDLGLPNADALDMSAFTPRDGARAAGGAALADPFLDPFLDPALGESAAAGPETRR